jgi:NUDIX domain
MLRVVAAVIEREDRRILIGQRRREDSSALKWEFPGGKVRNGEALTAALARVMGGVGCHLDEKPRDRTDVASVRELSGGVRDSFFCRENFQ